MKFFERFLRRGRLAVVDDVFPNILSAFRVAEYNHYLDTFRGCGVYSAAGQYDSLVTRYGDVYPRHRRHVGRFQWEKSYDCDLFYTIFLNAAYAFLPVFERERTSFVFTLYPGGGFWLDVPESDDKLHAVLGSPRLAKVIVTQKVTRDYLLAKSFCRPEKIEYIYGGVLPAEYYARKLPAKRLYQQDKPTFDICFVAYKYMPRGTDKGYDVFADVARRLCRRHAGIRFHVVGNFCREDIDLGPASGQTTFYGLQETTFFPGFYAGMDIILSPNTPFALYPGSFDGFPTGCCVEAGLSGVAIFCTDELGLNTDFTDGRDICLIARDSGAITDRICRCLEDVDGLYSLAERGQQKIRTLFAPDRQLGQRVRVLRQFL